MSGVLQGIRVLDLSRVFAGPAATQILGDLGADVIKVEEPVKGDEARYFGLTDEKLRKYGVSACYLALNRNKRSIALDLRKPAGQEIACRIALKSDVIVNNFRPGAMERWGLGYEDLHAKNPRAIYCSLTAYGDEGPLAHIGANDLALQAHGGLISLTGEEDRPPVRCGTAAVDLTASLGLVSGILAALLHRERTGEGQYVETSLLRGSAHLLSYFYTEYWLDGTVRKPMGTANHLSVPNQAFPCTDGQVVIISPSDDMWLRCAQALDAERLDRPEWRSQVGRRQDRKKLVEAMSAVTGILSSRQLFERLGPAKVNIAKVNSVGEAADDPQLAAIGGFVEFDYHGLHVKSVAPPFSMSAAPMAADRPPPMIGEHTKEVLRELGFADGDYERLETAGAFGPAVERARA